MTPIRMVYERLEHDPYTAVNLLSCDDVLSPHDDSKPHPRFNHPGICAWLKSAGCRMIDHTIDDRPNRYIYATSTFNGPSYWAGWQGNTQGFSSLFDHVPQVILDDMRNGRALFVIDQLLEGYSDDRLWRYLHEEMDRLSIPDHKIAYVSGNWYEAQRYHAWCQQHREIARVLVGSLRHLELVSQQNFSRKHPVTWRQRLLRRPSNVLLFNCLNRADRYHRNVMFMELWHADLLDQGLISMERLSWDWKLMHEDRMWTENQVTTAKQCLPLKIDLPDFITNPAFDMNPKIYDRTYVSVITETMAEDEPHSLFITEKVFKCIHQSHPFMVLGQRGHLRQLRDWGYETFHRFWDESYDDLPDMHDRARAIAGQLRHMATMTDLSAKINDMNDILQHNLERFCAQKPVTHELQQLIDWLLTHQNAG